MTASTEQIQGELEHIVFSSEDGGFTVARLRRDGRAQPTTVVGNLFGLPPGVQLILRGQWTNHKRFGRQFRVEHYTVLTPATADGIRRYLGSGLIKGIGPGMAKRLTDRFGAETLEVIEKEPERLAEVEGFGRVRIAQIREAWEEQREVRQIMLYLQGHGISPSLASRIYKRYGDRAIPMLEENPYRLAADVFGVGFKTADRIARAMGLEPDSPRRAEAGILHVLQEAAGEGHVFLPYASLMQRALELLEVDDPDLLRAAVAELHRTDEVPGEAKARKERQIEIEDLNEGLEAFEENHKAVYLPALHTAERGAADYLEAFLAKPPPPMSLDPDAAVAQAEERIGIRLAPEQVEAVRRALTEKCLVITGGPGTGKTTLVRALAAIFRSVGFARLLGAPTGRAAKRLQEVTGEPAKTLHRLLEYSYQQGGFVRNERNPLEGDLVIVDEASMIDCVLFYHLVKALPARAVLVLIGDVNQLPSVGPGRVLEDLIRSERMGVVRLEHIFRQAQESLIVTNAHRILTGRAPLSADHTEELGDATVRSDFYLIEEEDPERVAGLVTELYARRIPDRFGFASLEEIQVLSPMHRGAAGAENLNTLLQQTVNPQGPAIERAGWAYRLNDKVMQVRNNYDKEVFNGDIGRVTRVEPEQNLLRVRYDEQEVEYEAAELDELAPAYAISVHKSQGNEYPAVILPLVTQHYMLLQRNLLYTAVTRGKKLVVIVGTRKALGIAVRNNKIRMRHTLLARRLRQGAS